MFNKTTVAATMLGMFMGLAAHASILPCAAASSVLTIGSCSAGGETFSNFSVQYSGFTSVNIGLQSVSVVNDWVDFTFDIQTNPSVVTAPGPWVRLDYDVEADGKYLDGEYLKNTDGNNVYIFEGICSGEWKNGTCWGNKIGSLSAGPGASSTIQLDPVSHLSVNKHITFDDASITSFVNGTHIDAPEPITEGLMGLGLGMFGIIRRRKNRNKS